MRGRMYALAVTAACLAAAMGAGDALAQAKDPPRCGSMQALDSLGTDRLDVLFRFMSTENAVARRIAGAELIAQPVRVRWIPVVVHVVHNESKIPGTDISDERILSQIRILNEDFRRMRGTRGHNDHPDGADCLFQFRLATIDPEGDPTTGITRTPTRVLAFPLPTKDRPEERLKFTDQDGEDAWDSTRYLNLWVCNLHAVAGYAWLPGTVPANRDGVAVDFRYFGDRSGEQTSTMYRFGRTATHEVGHWLGLHHLWGPKDPNPNCSLDDFVEDTPRQHEPRTGTGPPGAFSCGSPDQIGNYLNYTDDAVMDLFTRGQSRRMNAMLAEFRPGIVESRPWDGTDYPLVVRGTGTAGPTALTFGLHALATDGVERALGEVKLPAAASESFFDARFLVGDGGEGTLADLRSPSASSVTWRLRLQGAAGETPHYDLQWDRAALTPGGFHLRCPEGGVADLDMRTAGGCRLNGRVRTVEIEWNPESGPVDPSELIDLLKSLRAENERLRLALEEERR